MASEEQTEMIPKTCKTPLRYPGGKSRATKYLFSYLPQLDSIKEYHEGFLGGGSVAIAFSRLKPDIPIRVNDLYFPLYNFWCVLKDYPETLHSRVMELKQKALDNDNHKELFIESKEILQSKYANEFEMAARFYVVNKCSFSGLTESSSFSKLASTSNFSLNGINNLLMYSQLMKNWIITNDCYSTLLSDDPNVFVYLDPPYDIKDNLYGKKGKMHSSFSHVDFAEKCNSSSSPTMISYNNDKFVSDRFPNWRQEVFKLTYTMRSNGSYNSDQSKRDELVLLNYVAVPEVSQPNLIDLFSRV